MVYQPVPQAVGPELNPSPANLKLYFPANDICCPGAPPQSSPIWANLSVAPVVCGDVLSPRPCLLWAPLPGLDKRPSSCLSAGLAALAPATVPSCLPAAPGARSSGPGHCSCPLAGLLSSRHTASGWISHPTSDSEKGKRRLRGGRSLGCTAALLSGPRSWADKHSPSPWLRLPPVLLPVQHLQLLQALGH